MKMKYRLGDLLLPPALVSLLRLPLGVCFALTVDRPPLALAVLLASGLSDVLDGWLARRYGQVTATGAVLDPVTDKLFVLTVGISLVIGGRLSLGETLLLATREIGEAPLVVWFALSHRARAARVEQPMANVPGKLVTVLQFVTVGWALFRLPGLQAWVLFTALAGSLAALVYWRRALRTSARTT
jgi:phosphatidylglycerophosphate synthase